MDRLDEWDFDLPADRIARRPAAERTGSRLLRVPLDGAPFAHLTFSQIAELLRPGDLLVVNDTRVMAARLLGRRRTGGRVELVVLEPGPGPVPALARPARRLAEGERIALDAGGEVRIVAPAVDGIVRVAADEPWPDLLERAGTLPLPPYLDRPADAADAERYQTVFAGPLGAAAAPTAGLHFDEALLDTLARRGIGLARVTLHVGLGTFRPLRDADLDAGRLHAERYEVPEATAAAIAAARRGGGRVVAVGTTTARTLETATPPGATAPRPGAGTTDLFIRPPYRFRGLDGLVTNFHLPRSSLLMLVAALVGRERLFDAYREAIARGYRFYSYGDAMLLL